MSNLAVQIEGLSKRYRVGVRNKNPMLREALIHMASAPLHFLRSWSPGGQHNCDPGVIWALRRVNFEVKEGEIVGIIGRNGAGKSTLLKILCGITDPTEGYIDIYGRVGSMLEVGTGFHLELTGRENIFMNGALLGMTRQEIKRKFDEIVAFSEVAQFLDTPVKRYSSGMYMRLAFAVAAHLEPDILVVDEVLAIGDASFQKKCLGKMDDVAKQGRTVLFVSHNMATIQALCQKAIWLDAGGVKEIGPTSEVVSRYHAAAMSAAEIPLATRTDRSGDSSVRLISVRLESVDQGSVIHTTSRLRVSIDYVSDKPLKYPQFCADLYNMLDVGIYTLDTRKTGEFSGGLPARGTVVCETDPINLAPGRCHVNLSVKNGGVWADRVDYASQFDIEPEDFYPTGRMPDSHDFIGVIKYKWSFEDSLDRSTLYREERLTAS